MSFKSRLRRLAQDIKTPETNGTKNFAHVLLNLLAFRFVTSIPVLLLTILAAVAVGAAASTVLSGFSGKKRTTTTARISHFAELGSDFVSLFLVGRPSFFLASSKDIDVGVHRFCFEGNI